jgi:hypothetical protein
MANGKPGDHPLSDILDYGASAFGPDIDRQVHELAALPGFATVRDRVARLLWDHWPAWQHVTPDLEAVRTELEANRCELGPA